MAGLLRLCFITTILLFLLPGLNTSLDPNATTPSPTPAGPPQAPSSSGDAPAGPPQAPSSSGDAPAGPPRAPSSSGDAPAGPPRAPSSPSDAPAGPPQAPTTSPTSHPGPPQVPPPSRQTPAGKGSSRGLSGGQKAGIVIGVLAGAGVLCLAMLVYMKRRNNIRRSQLATATRTPIL